MNTYTAALFGSLFLLAACAGDNTAQDPHTIQTETFSSVTASLTGQASELEQFAVDQAGAVTEPQFSEVSASSDGKAQMDVSFPANTQLGDVRLFLKQALGSNLSYTVSSTITRRNVNEEG